MDSNCNGVLIITTTDDKRIASKIAKLLVERRLAACVQIDEVDSHYIYEGEYCSHPEFRLSIKTTQGAASKGVEAAILKSHNYQCAQILKLNISGWSAAYGSFVNDAVKI